MSLLCIAVPARAEDDALPRMQTNRLEFQTDHTVAAREEDLLTPFSMHAQLRLSDWLSVEVEGSLLFARQPPVTFRGPLSAPAGSSTELGNLTVGASYLKMVASNVGFSVGLAVSAPVEKHREDSLDREREEAATRRAGLDVHLFLPQTTFIRFPMEWEVVSYAGRLRGRLTPVIWIPSSSLPTKSTSISIENWVEVIADSGWGMIGGLRAQAALGLREATPEESGLLMDAALFPFLGFEPISSGVTCRFGILLPLIGERSVPRGNGAVMLQGMVGLVF